MLTCVYKEIGVKMAYDVMERLRSSARTYIALAALAASLYACGGDKDSITGEVTGNDGNNGNIAKTFSDGVPGQLVLRELPDGSQTLDLLLNEISAEGGKFSIPPIAASVIDDGHEFDFTKDGIVDKGDISIFLAGKPSSQKARDFTNAFGYWEADNFDGRLDSGMNAKGEVYIRLPLDYLKLNGVTNIAAEIKNPAANRKSLPFNPAGLLSFVSKNFPW